MIKRILVSFVMLLVFSAPSLAAGISSSPPKCMSGDARFKNALNLYMSGSVSAAKDAFEEYLKEFPDGLRANDSLYWLAKYQEMKGRYDEAGILLRRAAGNFPTDGIAASIHFELAYCLYRPDNPKRDLNAAFNEFMKIPAIFAADGKSEKTSGAGRTAIPQALYYAAKCRMDMKDYAKASEIFTRVYRDFPGSPYAAPALYCLGMANLAQGSATDALSAFKTMLARYPAGLYSDRAKAEIGLIENAGKPGPVAKDSASIKAAP